MTQELWDRPLPRRLLEQALSPILHQLAATARLPADMVLPRLASRLLRERHAGLTEEHGHSGSVAYFHGCAANYFQDGVGDSVIEVLRRNAIDPVLPRQRCSGTPIETYGHVDRARAYAKFNIASLARFDTVVTGCASCTLMLKDYPKWFSERTGSAARQRGSPAKSGIFRNSSQALDSKACRSARFVKRSLIIPPATCEPPGLAASLANF